MPYRSGLFQVALGAICAVSFLVSNSFGSSDPKHKRAVVIVQKVGERSFVLTEENARQHTFQLSDSATVRLNAEAVSFSQLEDGRKASVSFTSRKGRLIATQIEIFPTHSDFENPA
jgi:hypothetical protein